MQSRLAAHAGHRIVRSPYHHGLGVSTHVVCATCNVELGYEQRRTSLPPTTDCTLCGRPTSTGELCPHCHQHVDDDERRIQGLPALGAEPDEVVVL